MIHPGLAALEKWEPIEYAAGYRARLAAIPDSEIAVGDVAGKIRLRKAWNWIGTNASWPRAGKMTTQRHGSAVRCDARTNRIAFDEGRTQPWKEGWITADNNIGLAGIGLAHRGPEYSGRCIADADARRSLRSVFAQPATP
jgi:hypothetical protein